MQTHPTQRTSSSEDKSEDNYWLVSGVALASVIARLQEEEQAEAQQELKRREEENQRKAEELLRRGPIQQAD